MKFIELKKGVSVREDEICIIEDKGSKVIVFVGSKSYESSMPYSTLLQILNKENSVPRQFVAL